MDNINCVATIVDPQYKPALFQNETERMHAIALLKKLIPDVIVDDAQNDGIQDHQVEKAPNKLPLSIQGYEPDPKMKAIDTYLAAPRLARHCNPHDWWRKNQHIAANFLAMPATQVASERVFSTARNIVTCRRELLLPRHVDELTFLHDNLNINRGHEEEWAGTWTHKRRQLPQKLPEEKLTHWQQPYPSLLTPFQRNSIFPTWSRMTRHFNLPDNVTAQKGNKP
ncbi:hypothetical protein PR048_011457 [Dryococelus australis]|uniref:HAT C-terminal dimerisation domain-containing protein n=1 Tax=Dryococelus australis TaxID=614101 RepID=A0ABQ9HLS9_9NEOP|nr:hypothetical protein PR048_011457 [Dryococelus australis]